MNVKTTKAAHVSVDGCEKSLEDLYDLAVIAECSNEGVISLKELKVRMQNT